MQDGDSRDDCRQRNAARTLLANPSSSQRSVVNVQKLLKLARRFIEDLDRLKAAFVTEFGEACSAQEETGAANLLELAAEAAQDFEYRAPLRDLFIQVYILRDSEISDREVCRKLDRDLAWGPIKLGLPPAWVQNYSVQTFEDAYDHAKLKNSVQVIIAKAKSRVIRIAGVRIVLSPPR